MIFSNTLTVEHIYVKVSMNNTGIVYLRDRYKGILSVLSLTYLVQSWCHSCYKNSFWY